MALSRSLALSVIALATVSCGSELRGTLEIAPSDDGGSVRFSFNSETGVVPAGKVFIEIQVDGAELLFGDERGTAACLGMPTNGVLVAGLPPLERLDCVTIVAKAYAYSAPDPVAEDMSTTTTTEVASRCGGDAVIDSASWRTIEGCPVDAGPAPRDGGSSPRDAGAPPDAGVVDSGVQTSTTG